MVMNGKLFFRNTGLFVALFFMLFTACKDDDNDVEAILGLGENTYQFVNNGGEYALAIFANVNWTLQKEGDWFTVSATSGSGNSVVKVKAQANEGDVREGTITVLADGMETQKITISQNAVEDAVLRELGKDAYEIKPEGGIMKLSVETNMDYTLEMSDWVEVSGSYALTKSEMTLHIEPNLWGKERSCQVVLRATETQKAIKTISLVQGSMAWNLPETVELNKFGEEQTVSVAVPEGWTWSIKDLFKGTEKEKWCHFTIAADGLKVVADKNTELTEREVSVLVTLDKTGMSKLITFRQDARKALDFDREGWGDVNDAFEHNEDCIAFEQIIGIVSDEPDGWEFTLTGKPDDWIVEKTAEGIRVVGTDRLEDSNELIQMEINVVMKDGSSSLKLIFRQHAYQAPTLVILNYLGGTENTEIIAAPEGGKQSRYVKFELGERVVCEPDVDAADWVHVTMTDEHNLSIEVDALGDGERARNGVIHVNLMRGDKVVATTEIAVQQGAEEPYIRLVDTEESLKYKRASDGKYKLPFGSDLSFTIKVESNVDWEITASEASRQYKCEKIDDTTILVSLTILGGPNMTDLEFTVHTKGLSYTDPINQKIILAGYRN